MRDLFKGFCEVPRGRRLIFILKNLKKKMAKVGIDSNIAIKLIEEGGFEEKIIFNNEDTVFMPPLCLWEINDCLSKKGVIEKHDESSIEQFTKKHNISLINKDLSKEEIQKFEAKCLAKGINCHHPDSSIILAFKAEGIEKVYSEDREFRAASRILGIKALRFPAP